ncbi:MAG: hypothetical protein GW903_09170 [Alphaproteobacteria bacterium]|nr:hypothetical protein [Alphaproteobacteria bacterium]NCQ89081.1 hypothetical protein [Alphaproteobacteria bacterium]NCT07981.1 hypothetical protein [Alphaproteobacteria bacterium]
MSHFKKFTPEETDLIVSLAYRAGYWISHVEDLDKTKRDDKWEAAAMDKAIRRIARQHLRGSFAGEVMTKVDKGRIHWTSWQVKAKEPHVLGDIQKAKDIILKHLSKKELKNYKQVLWYMGLVVAQAFGEDEDPDQEMHFNNVMKGIKEALFPAKLAATPENMSTNEKEALKKLRAALKG